MFVHPPGLLPRAFRQEACSLLLHTRSQICPLLCCPGPAIQSHLDDIRSLLPHSLHPLVPPHWLPVPQSTLHTPGCSLWSRYQTTSFVCFGTLRWPFVTLGLKSNSLPGPPMPHKVRSLPIDCSVPIIPCTPPLPCARAHLTPTKSCPLLGPLQVQFPLPERLLPFSLPTQLKWSLLRKAFARHLVWIYFSFLQITVSF